MEPTYNQINLLYRWISWKMPTPEAQAAVQWLRNNATRDEVSKEIKRVGDLYHHHKLIREECFNSQIWDRYKELKNDSK